MADARGTGMVRVVDRPESCPHEDRIDHLCESVEAIKVDVGDNIRELRREVTEIRDMMRGTLQSPQSGVYPRLSELERRMLEMERIRGTIMRAVGVVAVTVIGAAAIAAGAWVWQAMTEAARRDMREVNGAHVAPTTSGPAGGTTTHTP